MIDEPTGHPICLVWHCGGPTVDGSRSSGWIYCRHSLTRHEVFSAHATHGNSPGATFIRATAAANADCSSSSVLHVPLT